jgi:hypothetical protein
MEKVMGYKAKNKEVLTIPSPGDDATTGTKKRVARICKKLGYDYDGGCWVHYGDGDDKPAAYLPEGVIELRMAVRMMHKLGWKWEWSDMGLSPGWYKEGSWDPKPGEIMPNPKCLRQDDPHNLDETLKNLEEAIDISQKD